MQFSFAFSGKLHRVSISSGNRPRCTKCVSILSSKGSEHCSIEAFTACWQLIHYIRSIFICQELFQNFFRSFRSISFKTQTFLTAVSFETAYLLYQKCFRLSRTFFQNFFRSFWSNSLKTQTFLTAISFETAYLVYQTQNHLSRTFFILFKSFQFDRRASRRQL